MAAAPASNGTSEFTELALRVASLTRELGDARASLQAVTLQRDRAELALSDEKSKKRAELEAVRADAEREASEVIAPWRARIALLERERSETRLLEARLDELEAQAMEVAGLRLRNAELEAALAAASSAATPTPVEAPLRDVPSELQRVRGIGPSYARRLVALGFGSLRQVAAWSESDVASVARALRIRPERIAREDWIGRARALADSETE